ncbi:Exostosin-3 [Strongyloides ratti]|uniref:Exostosin-3 n=1 Tax=Strongyloides ratti TaxID=34506 RepID=A0A090L4F2_STRRB|nr:Exostosin-3 [Strongyloides ratti]CEF62359.1 Exostosin-3 [Strongyloides ratti]
MKLFIFYYLVFYLILIVKSQNVDPTIILYNNLLLQNNYTKYYYIWQNNRNKSENQLISSLDINRLIKDRKICLINNMYCLVSNTLSVEWETIQILFQESCIPIMTSSQVEKTKQYIKNDLLEKAIVFRENFSKNANCSTIADEELKKNFNISEIIYNGKKIIDEKYLLKDFYNINQHNSLTSTVPLYAEDRQLFSKSKLIGKLKFNLFTVIILTFRRISHLKTMIKNLGKNSKIDKIIVIWNDQNPKNIPKKSTWPQSNKPLYFVKTKKNSLNNRFLALDIITTHGVLSIDDDQAVNNILINKAFKFWQANSDVLVGHYTRRTFDKNKTGYFTKKVKSFDLILTGLAFINRKYLIKYTNEINNEIKNYVDRHMNCEDIVMNFLVAETSKKPNLFYDMIDNLRLSPLSSKGLSNKKNHYKERDGCVKHLIKVYGKNPMKKGNIHLCLNNKKC